MELANEAVGSAGLDVARGYEWGVANPDARFAEHLAADNRGQVGQAAHPSDGYEQRLVGAPSPGAAES